MVAGINHLRFFSEMITDWETNFTDLQANDFGNLGKNISGNILVGNHAVIFTEITVRAEIITELILKRAGPVIFKTLLLELVAFGPIPVICPARGVKPENYWKR